MVDLKIFELLVFAFSLVNPVVILITKSVSFIISTLVKFWGNKHWTFQKHEKEDIKKEAVQFFIITLLGTIIDVAVFYYATKVLGSHVALPEASWTKLSVIIAALASAIFNFLGYKFFVFKK